MIPAPISSPRMLRNERLEPSELQAFLDKNGISRKELSEIFGVSPQAVKLWVTGQREISVMISRLVKLFEKYPQLIREF